jgi:hypothetical protein
VPRRKPLIPGKRGAPVGNRNRLVHGRRTKVYRQLRAEIREHLAYLRLLLPGRT